MDNKTFIIRVLRFFTIILFLLTILVEDLKKIDTLHN